VTKDGYTVCIQKGKKNLGEGQDVLVPDPEEDYLIARAQQIAAISDFIRGLGKWHNLFLSP
jgi:hypothetical protein